MRLIKRVFIALVGGTILLVGLAMVLLPVPSLLVIIPGLAILGIEFAWARYLLTKAREYLPGKKSNTPPVDS